MVLIRIILACILAQCGHVGYGLNFTAVEPPTLASCPRLQAEDVAVTLITQTSVDRIWMVEHICTRWQGPFVVVVYIGTDNSIKTIVDHIDGLSSNLGTYQYACATLHLVPSVSNDEQYPINKLRNIGINNVQTSHFLMIDIDFWPDKGLHKLLTTSDEVVWHLKSNPLGAFVVPAFQKNQLYPMCRTIRECRKKHEHLMPYDRKQLKKCVVLMECSPFDYRNAAGHETTDFNTWINMKQLTVNQLLCTKSIRYEPYVVLRKCPSTPLYAEDFTGYGKNKIQLVSHLRFAGFQFYVIPFHYLIHFPHPKSLAKKKWRTTKMASENDALYSLFYEFLKDHYGYDNIQMQLCTMKPGSAKNRLRRSKAMWKMSKH